MRYRNEDKRNAELTVSVLSNRPDNAERINGLVQCTGPFIANCAYCLPYQSFGAERPAISIPMPTHTFEITHGSN